MGIEKIAGSGAMSYQGSAAMVATSGVGAVTQSMGESAPALSQSAQTQDFSFERKNGGGAEELGTAQSTQLKSAVNDFNKQMKNSEAVFGIHEETNRVTIKIVDKTTKEVIKEFPPEETLDMIAKVWEVAGILVDEKR